MPHHDNHKKLKDYVKEHMLNYVMVELKDGKTIDGIIEEIDGEHVYLLVPAGDEEQAENNAGNGNGNDRQFGFGPGFGYGGFGPGFGYGFGGYGFPGRFRYFRRRRFPFYGIRRFYPPYFY
ncbi:hypothetical protein BFG57_04090 [Bacillus solimangrovi]|uniref:Uncharacterized protein n=2 Tax=Bacillus solimangrovi TaxID=1305675 RepID=A0A1E5LC82_9BACI|nr:hypothetical protein BFG57_04090 [Bacillus solimangrovi]